MGSQFPASQGRHGLAAQLSETLPESQLEICMRDLFTESGISTDASMTQAALSAELRAEYRWGRYLDRSREPRWWFTYMGRWVQRLRQTIARPSGSYTRRLLNIEYSHRFLMRKGLKSGADWIVILEDDAACENIEDLRDGLLSLFSAGRRETLINLSDSFTPEQLGIAHMLHMSHEIQWLGDQHRVVLEAERPVTNTVCAMAYSRAMLARIVTFFEAMPEQPVLPIDWKLNEALMHVTATASDIQCLLLDPAPVRQLSMR